MFHIDPISFDLATACQKVINQQQRDIDKASVAAFKTAGVNPLSANYAVVVGALVAAATCSDPEQLEKYRLAGEKAIKGLLPDAFEPQPKSSAPSAAANPVAVVEDKMPENDEAAKRVEVAVDLIVILPERLEPDDMEAMEKLGLVCNTDTRRRKKRLDYIWQGHAAPETVEAIVLRYGATVNKVRLPIEPVADGSSTFVDPQNVAPEQFEMAMPTDLEAGDPSTFQDAKADTVPVASAGVDEARDHETANVVFLAQNQVTPMDHASNAAT